MKFKRKLTYFLLGFLSLLDEAQGAASSSQNNSCHQISINQNEDLQTHQHSQPVVGRKILRDSISIRVDEDQSDAENRSTFKQPETSELLIEPLVFPTNNHGETLNKTTEPPYQDYLVALPSSPSEAPLISTTEKPFVRWEPIVYSKPSPPEPSITPPATTHKPLLYLHNSHQIQQRPVLKFVVNNRPYAQQVDIEEFNRSLRVQGQHQHLYLFPTRTTNKPRHLSSFIPFIFGRPKKQPSRVPIQPYGQENLQIGLQSEHNPVVSSSYNQLQPAQQMLSYVRLPPVDGTAPVQAQTEPVTVPAMPPHQAHGDTVTPSHLLLQAQQHLDLLRLLQQQRRQPSPIGYQMQQDAQQRHESPYYNSINAQLPSANKHKELQQAVDVTDNSGPAASSHSLLANGEDLSRPEQHSFEFIQDPMSSGVITIGPQNVDHTAKRNNLVQKGEVALVQMLETMLKDAMSNGTVPIPQSMLNNSSKLVLTSNQPYQQIANNPVSAQTPSFNPNEQVVGYGVDDQMEPYPYHYGPTAPKKRSKNKKKNPSLRVHKRPFISSASNSRQPGFVNSNHELQPAGTFHKWKYPWRDDDDEEEGETEVNIRFFNNFSRMGPFGSVARAGGGASMVISLIFLILSNFSLAATIIAHGVSSFLRQLSGSPERVKIMRLAKSIPTTSSTTTPKPHIIHGDRTTAPGSTKKLDAKIKSFRKRWI